MSWWHRTSNELWGTNLWGQASEVIVALLVLTGLNIPFDLYRIFSIEERFGFNKTTLKLWMIDKLKGLLLFVFFSYPLLILLLFLLRLLGDAWWMVGALAVIGFQFLMLILYPLFIMPLFNKFTPLPKGKLKERLFALAGKTQFKAGMIEVMDGSRRSVHSNAFFTGFARFRKIVLFDTLIENLSPRRNRSCVSA